MRLRAAFAPFALALVLCRPALAQTPVTIRWDRYGVPHVEAATDAAAMFGLGWATAHARLFQMHLARLAYQGRTAEFFGPGQGDHRLRADRLARRLGWRRAADRAVLAMSDEERDLLEAYAAGVNAYAAGPARRLHPLFAVYRVPLEPWRARDCVGVWLELGRHFAGFAQGEAKARHTWDATLAAQGPEAALAAVLGDGLIIDRAAVVQQEDVPPAVQQAMADFAARYGVPRHGGAAGVYTPHFSQALAVAGSRTTTGEAVLLGEPRVGVRYPNLFLEWHVRAASFEVRGMGVPGSPNLLSGSSSHCAWSPTALGLDQADLFRLTVDDPAQPTRYLLDGAWLPLDVDEVETIHCLGRPDTRVSYQATRWGPVVGAELVDDLQAGELYSVKAVPLSETSRLGPAGFLGLYRARDVREVHEALEGWAFPSAHVVYADAGGRIGYTAVGLVPVRNARHPLAGVVAQDGDTTASDWQTFLPHALRPHVLDPDRGSLYSANHLTIGSWYPLKALFPGLGDGARSRRLGELLAERARFTPEDVRAFHLDRIDPNKRDLVRLGLYIQNAMGVDLGPEAGFALRVLRQWLMAGARLDAATPGAILAHYLRGTLRRPQDGDLVDIWGAGESGLSNFLEERLRGLALDPPQLPTSDEVRAVTGLLEEALAKLLREFPELRGQPLPVWSDVYRTRILTGQLSRWTTLGDTEPLQAGGLAFGPLLAVAASTNLSQLGDSFTQFVPVGRRDGAESLLALGTSEHDADPHALDQQRLWEDGALKPSPTSAAGLQALGVEQVLTLQAP